MNDYYYHTPKLDAQGKPLDTDAILAKDAHHKLNVLKAGDTPNHVPVANRAKDAHGKLAKMPLRARDGGEYAAYEVWLAMERAKPTCGPKNTEADELRGKCTIDPSPWYDCPMHVLNPVVPCPPGWPKKPD
jgi:hypothetical protein